MYPEGVTYISPAPKPYLNFHSIFQPLEPLVWLSLLASYILAICVFLIMSKMVGLNIA